MRIGIVNPLRIVETHLCKCFQNEELADCGVGLFRQRCRLQRLRADCSHRIERVARILRHEADFAATKRPEAPFRQCKNVLPVENNPARGVCAVGKQS